MRFFYHNRNRRDLSGGAEQIHLPTLAEAVNSFKTNGDIMLPIRMLGQFDTDKERISPEHLRDPREFDRDMIEAAALEREMAAQERIKVAAKDTDLSEPEKAPAEPKKEANPEGAQ